ncbi:ParB/RepB/Spo0J family partition protein [Paracraurococcus ruber]|uniref:Chromosome partitioning protein ParB n=1 Tax=Paracraurococcus ruber TaxID=77675 RepID=A0ABS1CZ51_9PROT|nr:ParB/RepB/Spo0J family partition protein [Paracraurococcus ruber]MBK1659481.1 chromosome partitioning protein ParB [Paracraurococcus ruber]TDG33644.1 ParB/RepB/Spo0J family partition protein [Paracraurococcus ruber]
MSGAKKPLRLGRGLSALLGEVPPVETPAQPASEGIRTLPIELIEPGPFQPRGPIDQGPLQELADSIREHGVLQPILVRDRPGAPGRYEIIGGERRWRAAQLAQLHEVPVVLRNLDDRQAMAAALVENLQRQDLNALEEAEGFRRLTDEFGLTQDQLGQAVGKSRSHVANTLRLLALPDRVRELLRDGALTAGHARALLTSPDAETLALQVVDRGLNVRQTEALVASKPRDPAGKPQPAPETMALEKDLSNRLGLKVSIKHGDRGGQVTIAYRDLDQLDGLIRLLNP